MLRLLAVELCKQKSLISCQPRSVPWSIKYTKFRNWMTASLLAAGYWVKSNLKYGKKIS